MTTALNVRALLLAGAALLPGVAAAQTDPVAAPQTDAPAATEETAGSDIVVTGSRIQRPDYEAPNPIVSLDADKIVQSGQPNLTEFLRRVPALTNSLDNSRVAGKDQGDGALGGVGLNTLDLRGLGPERTLVLVNGRRHVAGQFDSAAVDVNAIPMDLVQRVDVLTGAASAVYGADGVSGVVNFVTKRDFDGLAARVQAGISEQGDAGNRFASLILGRNFADGRANITLAGEYNAEDALSNDSRAFLRQENRIYFVDNPNYDPANPSSYFSVPVGDLRYGSSSTAGLVYIGNQIFRGDGQIYRPGTSVGSGFTQGGDDTPVAGYIGDILPSTERYAGNLLAKFDASDAFNLTFEGKFVQTTARTLGSYSGSYPNRYSLDSPFIPQTIRDAAIANGDQFVDVFRNNFDLPRRGEEDRRRTYRVVVDVAGKVSDTARYDVYYTYGRTDLRATKLNDRLRDRFLDALDGVRDASGQIVCRSATARAAGCVPLNSFGDGTANPAAFDYFLSNPVSNARLEQHVVNASLTGNFGDLFTLPGGPVEFAVGGEYRKESSRFDPAADLVNNLFYQYDEYIIPTPSRGSFDVWEAFGEINVPLLKDQPFAELLSVGAAGRYSDYSTIGSTKTYAFNAIWSPVRAITFRGSYGQSVRAPNIGELFRTPTGTSNYFDDPCYVENRTQPGASPNRAANCVALIQAAGGNPATFTGVNNENQTNFIPGISQGNEGLRPESARTWTAGVLFRPDFVPGLQIAFDWYDIRLRDAIATPAAQTVAELCVDAVSLDNAFCNSIDRRTNGTPTNPSFGDQRGYISGFRVQPQNVADFQTAGAEMNLAYTRTLSADNKIDVRFIGGYLHKLTQIPLPGSSSINNLDRPFRPQWTATFSPTLTSGPVTVAYNLRWQNGVRRFAREQTNDVERFVDPRYFRFKELWQHDIQVGIAANEQFSWYVGVNNLGNQKPDIGFETNVPISPVGRYFYAGARVNLGR